LTKIEKETEQGKEQAVLGGGVLDIETVGILTLCRSGLTQNKKWSLQKDFEGGSNADLKGVAPRKGFGEVEKGLL